MSCSSSTTRIVFEAVSHILISHRQTEAKGAPHTLLGEFRTAFGYRHREEFLLNLSLLGKREPECQSEWLGSHGNVPSMYCWDCLLYTSDAADDLLCVDL